MGNGSVLTAAATATIETKRRTRGNTIVVIGGLVAIAYVLFAILLATFFRVDIREYVGPITLLPGLVLLLASIVAGFLTDYFKPAKAHRTAGQPGLAPLDHGPRPAED
jgi:hypothetical protein